MSVFSIATKVIFIRPTNPTTICYSKHLWVNYHTLASFANLRMNLLHELLNTVTERREYLYVLLKQHIVLSLGAIAITTFIGVGTGILILYKSKLRQIILGLVNFLYTIPTIAMFGLFIPFLGIGFMNALLVLVIYGLLPVIRNTYTGLSEVDSQFIDAAKGMGSTRLQIFTKIRWPLAFPTILSGFRTMVVMTISLAGLASFIGAGGLGQAIYRGINTNNSALIIVGSVSVALVALVADLLIGLFEKSIKTNFFSLSKKGAWFKHIAIFVIIALFLLFIIYQIPGSSKRTIVVASKPTSEQYILGEIMAQLIEGNTNLKVQRRFGIGGGTSNIHPAMLSGEIDIYPEYTGTAWLFVLKKSKAENVDSLYTALKETYNEKYKLTWICRLGFNNTYTLALPEEIARQERIKSFSDLAAQSSQFVFGAEFDFFEREDGFPGLKKTYPFHFKKTVELDINLKFQALQNHTVNVIDAFSTDSRIRQLNLLVLTDDKHFFPAYQAGIVIRNQTLQQYPVLGSLLLKLKSLIHDADMLQMNYEVEIIGKTPEKVAREFLEYHHLTGISHE